MVNARLLLDEMITSMDNSFDARIENVHIISTITKYEVFENDNLKSINGAELSLKLSEPLAVNKLRKCADIDALELDDRMKRCVIGF